MSSAAAFQMPPEEDHRVALLVIWWTGLGIASIFMVLRLWARIHKRFLGLDDAVMAASWLCFAGDTVLIHYIAQNGYSRHLLYMAMEGGGLPGIDNMLKLLTILLDIGIWVTGLGKVAIGITILRIIGDTSQWQKYAVRFVMFLTVSTCIVDFCFTTFRCGDPDITWTLEKWPTANCLISLDNQTNFNTFANASQVFADFAFSLLPMFVVWRMRLPLRQRVRVVIALGLTLITGAFGLAKAYYAATMDTSDISWTIFPSVVCFGIESTMIIVFGSMPSLYPLYQLAVEKVKSSFGSGSKSNTRTYVNASLAEYKESNNSKQFAEVRETSFGTNDPRASDPELGYGAGERMQTVPAARMAQYPQSEWSRGTIQVLREVDVKSSHV